MFSLCDYHKTHSVSGLLVRIISWQEAALSIIAFLMVIRSFSIKSARISSSMFPSAPSIRCPLPVGTLSPFSAMCIADDVTGLSVTHGGRRIVGVVASGQVQAVEHHLELVLISARFYRFPRLLDTPIGYFLYFRSNPLNYSDPLLFAKVAYS